MLHQTIIGLEAKKQLEKVGDYPDVVIGCAGGGSNFAGLAFPFALDKINGKDLEIYPVEPEACPTLTRAPFVYDHGDVAGYTPMLPMHSLGHSFIPAPIHAGGLRYHGMAPTVSQLVMDGIATPKSVPQLRCYEAGVLFARTEGIIPAPESTHAIAAAVDAARQAKEEGKEKVILFNLSGHGLLDLGAYDKYFSGDIKNLTLPMRCFVKVRRCLRITRSPGDEEPVDTRGGQRSEGRNDGNENDTRQRRCPRFGGPVIFGYCRTGEENRQPCLKIIDCWWESFDIMAYVNGNFSEESCRELCRTRPKPKMNHLLELIEAAKKRMASKERRFF